VVPYKSVQSAYVDLQSGALEVLISSTGGMAPFHKDGRFRMLATSGSERSLVVPDVPTFKEAGVDTVIEIGALLTGPAKMPADVVASLFGGVAKGLQDPEVVSRLKALGMTPHLLSPTELAAWLRANRELYAGLAKAANVVPE
jgi:tripartite-type tricarboxylate transporter receptor subunit TctC